MTKNRPPVIYLDSVNSTNIFAQELIRNHHVIDGTIISAYHQFEGRGQRGNKWTSNSGDSLTISVIKFPPDFNTADFFLLNICFAMSVYDFIHSYGLQDVFVKWPNDIIVSEKKIAGILLENSIKGSRIMSVVAGIGLNLNQTAFSGDFGLKPVSLYQITGKRYLMRETLDQLLTFVDTRYLQLFENPSQLRADYISKLFRINVPSVFHSDEKKWNGIIRGISKGGMLLIENENQQINEWNISTIKMVG
jgi:BirA family biotin operon repressor/biotin-[acetyl-CoA-carboxylase] ligase